MPFSYTYIHPLQLLHQRLNRLPQKRCLRARRRSRHLRDAIHALPSENTARHLLDHLARAPRNVDVLPVDVVPRAAGEDGDVVRQVEDRGDEGEAREEEDDGPWGLLESVKVELRRGHEQKMKRSQGWNMFTAKVTSSW